MNSVLDELKEQVFQFGKKATSINEMHNQYVYNGKPLLQNFDTLLNDVIELSQQVNQQLRNLKSYTMNPQTTKQKIQEYETIQLDFFKYIELVQDIQTKIIERKKENLRSYNKSIHHRQRSQISGLRSQMSLGTNNNLGESKLKDKSFTTVQNDKTESFVRMSNQNSSSTPNNCYMYRESGGSSMLDEDSQDNSDLDLSGDPQQDLEKLQKLAESTETQINDQIQKFNVIKDIQAMIKKEQELRDQEVEEKKKQNSQSSVGTSQPNSFDVLSYNPKQGNTYKAQQSIVNNKTTVNNQSTVVIVNPNSDTVYVKMNDNNSSQVSDRGTSYEQSKKKKYIIILIIIIILIGIGVGVGVGLSMS